MRKKNLKILGVILIFLFSLNIFTGIINQGIIPANNQKKSENEPILDIKDEETINEEPLNKESPKTAGSIELEHDYDFSFNTTIDEVWNNSLSFTDYNTSGSGPSFWMQVPEPKGRIVSFQFNISNLRNSTGDLIDKDFFSGPFEGISVQFWNYSKVGNGDKSEYFQIQDAPGLGNSTCKFKAYINETYGAVLRLASLPYATYDAVIYLNISESNIIKTEFIPDTENTDSDSITWDLNYQSSISAEGNYSANLQIENFSDFTLKSVAGKNEGYWQPITYIITATGIILNEHFDEFSIQLTTPNYISIIYNDNLTFIDPLTGKGTPNDNELHLSVTCKAAGNLTIYFRNSTNDVNIVVNQTVAKDEIVFYNYIMNQTTPGGLGSLEIILMNKSDKINFGLKFAEVTFYKNALIMAYSDNTTAFSEFFVLAAYIDIDKLWMLLILNATGHFDPYLTEDQALNQSSIVNATVTYNLEGLAGELDYSYVPLPGINFSIYNLVIDLKEFQIVPGDYNLTFRANKIGYSKREFISHIVISKKDVIVKVDVIPTDQIIEVEENFAITISFIVYVSYFPWYETFLRVPVDLSFEILKDGKLDEKFIIPDIVQSFTIQAPMENDTIPGEYDLNITIISDYYRGNFTVNLTVIKKPLTINVAYDEDDLEEGEEFELTWELSGGSSKNRENMSVDVFIDGIYHATYNLNKGFSGITKLELDEGDYYVTYRLISPFYTAETTVKLEIEGEEEPEPTWLEENWLWVLIGIIAIIVMAALAVFLLISRHKVKAKRALDSELVALKTKTTASEQKISLIEAQISQIASIYWIIIVHSEQGTTMVEISDFRFGEVLDEKYKHLIGKGMMRDSALIGGFLTAIRNFSRETSDTSLEYQPVFNSQTDYSTVVDDNEIHRRILEGTNYFMAFVSSRGTIEISDVLSSVNTLFQEEYGEMVEKFNGAISPFRPFEETVVDFLHNEIRELQKKLKEEQLLLGQFEGHLKEVQEKIGIKPKKSADLDYK